MLSTKILARRLSIAIILLLLSMWLTSRSSDAATTKSWITSGNKDERWQKVTPLIQGAQYEAASALVADILTDAEAKGHAQDWTEALIKRALLRIALQGYETALSDLRQAKWPDNVTAKSLLNLTLAHTLNSYFQAYSYEIRQRERQADASDDPKRWTVDDIAAGINRAYANAWAERGRFSELSDEFFAPVLKQGNFPATIRPSIRDSLSYLWAAQLSDSAFWDPQAANEAYRLNVNELVGSNLAALMKVDPLNLSIHPLLRAARVLSDLEAWYLGKNNQGAALEAYLERLRIMVAAFPDQRDADLARTALAARLNAKVTSAWWSMGAAQLANFHLASDAADSRLQALEWARKGLQAGPKKSLGAESCAAIIADLEAPSIDLEAMAHDGLARRSILVKYRNLTRLYFRAYRLDEGTFLAQRREPGLLYSLKEITELLTQKPSYAWEETLFPTADYRTHNHYVTPKIGERGIYVVLASVAEDFARHELNALLGTTLVLSDIVLQAPAGESSQGLRLRVVSGINGHAELGVKLSLYERRFGQPKDELLSTLQSDAEGTVHFPIPKDPKGYPQYFVTAVKGQNFALLSSGLTFAKRPPFTESQKHVLYTDRSLYRPGQTIQFKVVAYRGIAGSGKFRSASGEKITVQLKDANHQIVAEIPVTTNSYSTASGSFVIPELGHGLGEWSLQTTAGSRRVGVEEYRRPNLEGTWLSAPTPSRLNALTRIEGEVKYFFGAPLSAGTVAWTVTRTPQYPSWWSVWFNDDIQHSPSPAQQIAYGKGAVKNGRFSLAFIAEANPNPSERERSLSYSFHVTATVTADSGETVSLARKVTLGYVGVRAHVANVSGFLLANQPHQMTVIHTSLDGDPIQSSGEWRLAKLKEPAAPIMPADQTAPTQGRTNPFNLPSDQQRPRWQTAYSWQGSLMHWPTGETLAQGESQSNLEGQATLQLPPLSSGIYRLIYKTKDAQGETFTLEYDFIMSEAKKTFKAPLPLVLAAEHNEVRPGDTLRLIAHSGFTDQILDLKIYRGAKIVKSIAVKGGESATISWPVTTADEGGLRIALSGLRDYQALEETVSIAVPWVSKTLKIHLASFRERLRPGAKETWTIRVTDAHGRGVAAEVLAYMYDRSLDAILPHDSPDMLSIYQRYPSPTPKEHYSLGSVRALSIPEWGPLALPVSPPHLEPTRLEFFDDYPVGGAEMRGSFALSGGRKTMMMANDSDAKSAPVDGAKTELDAAPKGPLEIRRKFSETAVFSPHVMVNTKGDGSLSFQVPDSTTAWKAWFHALSKNLMAGSQSAELVTTKELVVETKLPRFLRENDHAKIRMMIHNTGTLPHAGTLRANFFDPETKANKNAIFGLPATGFQIPFAVKPQSSEPIILALSIPSHVGSIAIQVIATSPTASDGEERNLPVLPGRMRLATSRFAAIKGGATRNLSFKDALPTDDSSLVNEQLVVGIDAQLLYSLFKALPYIIEYPYESSELHLSRFLATGILASVYREHPELKILAANFGQERSTAFDPWRRSDPNRSMTLEETPWLEQSSGARGLKGTVINILEADKAEAVMMSSLESLTKMQLADGGVPWFPGGHSSPFMTLSILNGLARGLEFGANVPRNFVTQAWNFLALHLKNPIVREEHLEFFTYLNYVASSYPDALWLGPAWSTEERTKILDLSFAHWKKLAPQLKLMLALTLSRMKRSDDSLKILDSVMDTAKVDSDLGTYWQPEERAWLWYNDTIETHAFALYALTEIRPSDRRRDGLVQWIFLNKKLNSWHSTRATAEVIYAIVHYLKGTKGLGNKELVELAVGPRQEIFSFAPESYTAKDAEIIVPRQDLEDPRYTVISATNKGSNLAFITATWHFATNKIPEKGDGDLFHISRRYFLRTNNGKETLLTPITKSTGIKVGDEIEVQLLITAKHSAEYLHLRDPRPAGFEPVAQLSEWKWDFGVARFEETRDSGSNIFFERLPPGDFTHKYRLRAAFTGDFQAAPATLQSQYAPEFNAFSAGSRIKIGD